MGIHYRISGGVAPYRLKFQVTFRGSTVSSHDIPCGNNDTVTYMPTQPGQYQMSLVLYDSAKPSHSITYTAGVTVQGKATFEYPETWEATLKDVQLTGDMAQDLIAIAESQLGYKTSSNRFITDEQDNKHYYSRYGEWYGAPYSEWCAMYIAFCAHYANVPETVIPKEGGCIPLMDFAKVRSAYHVRGDGYTPAMGDILFLDWTGEGIPVHVGIVKGVVDGKLQTIEGNTSNGVANKTYDLDDEHIMGYSSMQQLIEYNK